MAPTDASAFPFTNCIEGHYLLLVKYERLNWTNPSNEIVAVIVSGKLELLIGR